MEVSGKGSQWHEGCRWVGRRKGGRSVEGGGRRFPKKIGVQGATKKNLSQKKNMEKWLGRKKI